MKPLPEICRTRTPRIRVLLLTDEMEVGGTQRQILHLARGLDRQHFDPTVLYFRTPSAFVQELEAAGVPVIQVEKRGRIDPDFMRRLVRTLRVGSFDVMHCFAFSGELWGAVARRFVPAAQRPVLLSSVRGTYEWYSPWQWRLKRWVSSQSQCIIANSAAGAEYACLKMGLPQDAIDLVYNGVAVMPSRPEARSEVRQALGLGPATPLALFVGRLVEHKNLPTLLQALYQLQQGRRLDLRLAIAGEGPLRGLVEHEIARLGLQQQVLMLGERKDVADLMAAAHFLVLPSLREGLSNVILEAMMAGLPVIASQRGGNIELVEHDRTGLLFDATDAAALAQAMAALMCDGSLRRRLAAAARARVQQHHSIAAMVRATERHYLAAFNHRLAPVLPLARTIG